MRLILVPPYRGAGYDFQPDKEPYYQRAIELMQKEGELDGVTVEVDPGVHTDHTSSTRDETLFDHLAIAVQSRVRELTAKHEHDAIVVLGAIDVGFHACRLIGDVPVAYPLHSAVHVASMLADRFSLIDVTDVQATRQRRLVRGYGLDDKLGSIRSIERTSTDLSPLLRDIGAGESTPAVDQVLDQFVEQSKLAVDVDRADLLVIGFAPIQALKHELRARLDDAGLADIQVVWGLSSAVAVAKAMVAMQLLPARRAFPADALVAKPAYR